METLILLLTILTKALRAFLRQCVESIARIVTLLGISREFWLALKLRSNIQLTMENLI